MTWHMNVINCMVNVKLYLVRYMQCYYEFQNVKKTKKNPNKQQQKTGSIIY